MKKEIAWTLVFSIVMGVVVAVVLHLLEVPAITPHFIP
jgi:hypothetical protein